MSLSQPITIFGVHSIAAYNISTGMPLGIAKVIGSAELSSEGELVALTGGSSKYPYKVERGAISAQLSLKLSEYPPFLFETLLGKAMTTNSAESGGSVTTLTNAYGTSLKNATTGVASVAVVTAADVKFGRYVVKAVSATTVDVYALTDLDFANGTDLSYVNDSLKITSSPLTVTSGGDTTIPNTGIKLVGGSGTIGMTTGDTATFSSRPINTESQEVTVGSSTEVFNDFGLVITAQRPGDKYMTLLDCFKVAGSGLPIALTAGKFSEASISMQLYRDSTKDGIYKLERVLSAS